MVFNSSALLRQGFYRSNVPYKGQGRGFLASQRFDIPPAQPVLCVPHFAEPRVSKKKRNTPIRSPQNIPRTPTAETSAFLTCHDDQINKSKLKSCKVHKEARKTCTSRIAPKRTDSKWSVRISGEPQDQRQRIGRCLKCPLAGATASGSGRRLMTEWQPKGGKRAPTRTTATASSGSL